MQGRSIILLFANVCIFLGPALGAFLFELGGFTLPFLVVGIIGFLVATSLVFVIPDVKTNTETSENRKTLTLTDIAKVRFFIISSHRNLQVPWIH